MSNKTKALLYITQACTIHEFFCPPFRTAAKHKPRVSHFFPEHWLGPENARVNLTRNFRL